MLKSLKVTNKKCCFVLIANNLYNYKKNKFKNYMIRINKLKNKSNQLLLIQNIMKFYN